MQVFNPFTGTISFAARLSVAATYLGKGRQEPTHDLFPFKGTLDTTRRPFAVPRGGSGRQSSDTSSAAWALPLPEIRNV
jgi:hypothetical protein